MANLLLRSVLVLSLMFGLLFAIGMVVLTAIDAPVGFAIVFALGILFLQYLLGPWILQLIYKIEWRDPKTVSPALAVFIDRVCEDRKIPHPRFGVIRDGNPNAFTFGHYPGDARLVVTTGLLELLDGEEYQAVVAHELGHIAHWDFVVMTVAAAIPLILYVLYRFSISRGRNKEGAYLAVVGVVSYVAYIVSQFIALLLSRVREYYADQFAAEVTGNPNALSSALVKVAYGLATAPRDKKDRGADIRLNAARAFGIFDPKAAQGLALAGAASGTVTLDSMQNAMKWDLWNPWAFFFELSSTHPLAAKRIRALGQQSEAIGQIPRLKLDTKPPESYWDEFAVDLVVKYLPNLALIASGLAVLAAIAMEQSVMAVAGAGLLITCLTWWLQRRIIYRHNFDEARTVNSLISEVKVSPVRPIACQLEGEIIGRGVPGLFYSEDLVLQDNSGYITVDYRQPLGIVEFLFGWLKADKLVGRRGKAFGWYRRAMRPYFEMRWLVMDNGEKITSYTYPLTQFFVYAGMLAGVILLALGFVR
ncbi:MAG: M48 family metalloprotease [Chloroflexi bacterium]|nr:M48 family metalloprotease [Chloroflexota bacterium]